LQVLKSVHRNGAAVALRDDLRNLKVSPTPSHRVAVAEASEFDRLAGTLGALAYGARLELLHLLRFPRLRNEIRLTPRQGPGNAAAASVMSRQAVAEHLEKLVEIGVVTESAQVDARGSREYTLNTQGLYRVMEEFRQIGTVVCAGSAAGSGVTADLAPLATMPPPGGLSGPRLVLVHGLLEGKVFPLHPEDCAPGSGWILGRKSGLPVALDYDPYASLENSEIVAEEGRYHLRDLPGSRNGTRLNWARLGKGEQVPLTSGDVVGVGRSLLVFRDGA